MLMEKGGYAEFKVYNPKTKEYYRVENSDFLTPTQEKQMAFQPDFILEYAHFLKDYFEREKGVKTPRSMPRCMWLSMVGEASCILTLM